MVMQIDIDAIQYNLQSAFHMLRHFETATPEINSTLINKGYSQKDIDNELSLVGSKFNEAFATDISGLLERFKQYSFISLSELSLVKESSCSSLDSLIKATIIVMSSSFPPLNLYLYSLALKANGESKFLKIKKIKYF